jgi:LmbE family N-acetylglucosaminyl deacetylase
MRLTLAPLTRLRGSLFSQLRDETERYRRSSAIVFAPHQDDECLGCGGTIILKRDAGISVKIVFMTDGSTSHSRLMPPDELHRLRNAEAMEAARKLGVHPSDVQFLDFPDGRLNGQHAEAVAKVLAILEHQEPEEVFVPFRSDRTPDHEATNRIVVDALRQIGRGVRVCEYPVWLWNVWPWVPVQLRPSRSTLDDLRSAFRTGLGRSCFKNFQSGVFIGDVLNRKREAQAQHRSQMTRLRNPESWPILSDVSDGRWLECFFQPYEVFLCWQSQHPASQPALHPRD